MSNIFKQSKQVSNVSNTYDEVVIPNILVPIVQDLSKTARHILEIYSTAVFDNDGDLDNSTIMISTKYVNIYGKHLLDADMIHKAVEELKYCSINVKPIFTTVDLSKDELKDECWIILDINECLIEDFINKSNVINYTLEESYWLQHKAYCLFAKCLVNKYGRYDAVELSDEDIYGMLRIDKDSSLKEINAVIEACIEDITAYTDILIPGWRPYTGRALLTPYYMEVFNKYCKNYNIPIGDYINLENNYVREFNAKDVVNNKRICDILKWFDYTYEEIAFICYLADIACLNDDITMRVIEDSRSYADIINTLYYEYICLI